MRPVVDRLRVKYAGKVDIKRMNTSEGSAEVEQLAQSFGIQYVPTFVFVNSDGTKSGVIVGQVAQATLEAEIAKLK